jgi:outer membrane protein OmpA-like peptidoglycan-associated protein
VLEEMEISGDRIKAKGFGPNKPIASNETEEGRAKTRRTEFQIL